ncbi:uncharacterized protein LOC132758914 [Ruditapes philippinarum]|uniref:uncharacterized protein LOC132758914 n=1 Tax=Ruditapes philippinarum TaxID=129788 RepID=UPI00295BFF4D|nr:uncharacterized protein LOC132758914 [Ruditapes philippinarum]
MSVSDVNVSWSTRSSIVRSDKSTERSVFLTSCSKHGADDSKKPKCVSAKHSGMRFQGWREPKPLRSRCSSAVNTEDLDKNNAERLKSAKKSVRDSVDEQKETLTRLSQPTTASRWKSARTREVGTDMNYYSWAKMNVYKDYQKVMYGANGTAKKPNRIKER